LQIVLGGPPPGKGEKQQEHKNLAEKHSEKVGNAGSHQEGKEEELPLGTQNCERAVERAEYWGNHKPGGCSSTDG